MNIYEVIMTRLKDISQKEVKYSYEEELNFNNSLLLEDRFILRLDTLKSETISVNHRKQKERELSIKYSKFNNIKTNLLNEVINVENILDKLVEDDIILENILNMNYELSVEYENIEESDLTGVIIFNITLYITERTK